MLSIIKGIRRALLVFYRNSLQKIITNSTIGKFLKLKWKTNHQVIDLVTTSRCNSMCYDCSQMCRQAPAKDRMSTDQVKKFIKESVENKKKWKKIVITGGESILEDNFFEILEVLREYRANHNKILELVLLTNGRGNRVKELIKRVPQDIKVFSTNKTSSFQPNFISINSAPIDDNKHKLANFKAGCRFTKQCGMSLNWNGYYCCSTAGAIDRVLGLDLSRKKMPELSDNFEDQKDALCRYCGFFLSCNYRRGKGYYSPSWAKALNRYKKQG